MAEAATAEHAPRTTEYREEYAKSMRTIRAIGKTSVGEFSPECELARDDFLTGVAEMLKTDAVLRERLDVDNHKTFQVSEEKVVAADGTSMVELVSGGLDSSKRSSDMRIATTQATRDYGDVITAKKADALRPGESFIVASTDLAEEISGADKEFWESRGYRKGITYLQWYAMEEGELQAGAISVDNSELSAWKALFEEWGVDTAGATSNTFIQRAIHLSGTNAQETHQLARRLRRDYYERVGASRERQCVSDFLSKNHALLDEAFNTYYPSLGRALSTGQNEPVLQDFAHSLLSSPSAQLIRPQTRRELIRTASSNTFDDTMGRELDDAIRYSVVELLRKELVKPRNAVPHIHQIYQVTTMPRYNNEAIYVANLQQSLMQSFSTGVSARRSYGGCSGTSMSAANELANGLPDPLKTPQDIFGGNAEVEKDDDGPDGLGPLTFKCTEGHTNTRKEGKLLTECQTKPCKKGSVGC